VDVCFVWMPIRARVRALAATEMRVCAGGETAPPSDRSPHGTGNQELVRWKARKPISNSLSSRPVRISSLKGSWWISRCRRSARSGRPSVCSWPESSSRESGKTPLTIRSHRATVVSAARHCSRAASRSPLSRTSRARLRPRRAWMSLRSADGAIWFSWIWLLAAWRIPSSWRTQPKRSVHRM
jgi:hypothetical protein